MDVMEKLAILADAAKYDAACTSSGVDRKGTGSAMGNSRAAGICHSFSADGRCISLLKVLLANYCSFDCAYCVNRRSNTTVRTAFTPRELAELTWQFYRRNYIEGLFLSSAVWRSPDYTCEQMLKVLEILRKEYRFGGYIHAKVIPGTDPLLLDKLGRLADRISINIELPSEASLKRLAPDKAKEKILRPMGQICRNITENTEGQGRFGGIRPVAVADRVNGVINSGKTSAVPFRRSVGENRSSFGSGQVKRVADRRPFAPAGQSTQMIIGATGETDYQILRLTESLYHTFQLKRVFYSAYIPVVEDSRLPTQETLPPLWREHRLYQADWLLRFYGFAAGELLTETQSQLHPYLDPKSQWALRHPEYFPLEVNRASLAQLLRVPGIGVRSARRIVQARRICALHWGGLKQIGVVLKKARYFLLCGGKKYPQLSSDQNKFLAALMSERERGLYRRQEKDLYQPSLFEEEHKTLTQYGMMTGGAGDLLQTGGSAKPLFTVPLLTDAQKEELVWTPIPIFV